MLIESARLMIRAYLEEIESLDSLDKMELAMDLESFIDDNEHHDPDVDKLIQAFLTHYPQDYLIFKFTTNLKIRNYLAHVEKQA